MRPLFRTVVPQIKSFSSYIVVVDCAKMVDVKKMEVHVSQERTKKPKTEGGFSDQSSGATSKRFRL